MVVTFDGPEPKANDPSDENEQRDSEPSDLDLHKIDVGNLVVQDITFWVLSPKRDWLGMALGDEAFDGGIVHF